MELWQLLELCKAYADMGSAVCRQLHEVVDNGESLDEQNNNALDMIKDFLDRAVRAGVEGAEEESERIARYLKKQAA